MRVRRAVTCGGGPANTCRMNASVPGLTDPRGRLGRTLFRRVAGPVGPEQRARIHGTPGPPYRRIEGPAATRGGASNTPARSLRWPPTAWRTTRNGRWITCELLRERLLMPPGRSGAGWMAGSAFALRKPANGHMIGRTAPSRTVPCRRARRSACICECTWSLARMLVLWFRSVRIEM
jgi:hypothetical protein